MAKPLPTIMKWDRGFWDNARQGVFSAQECSDCKKLQFYPRPVCIHCFSRNLKWKPLSGKGSVHSFTIVRRPLDPVFRDDVPSIFADIELEEGLRIHSDIIKCSPEQVKIGKPVRVVFKESEKEEIHVPYFVLA